MITLRREFDAAYLNAIVNHPMVHPFVTLPGQDTLDLTAIVDDRRNIVLACDGGAFVLIQHEPGIYEVHSQFLPHARGIYALEAARQAAVLMFTQSDAMELLTKVPVGNRRAEALAFHAGFRLDFERPDAWTWRGSRVALRHYALRYPDFVNQYADELDPIGEWFHDRLNEQAAALGVTFDHPEDPSHDRHVGAATAMIQAGLIAKGLTLYNRWARFAGYDTVTMVSVDPLVMDAGGGCLLKIVGQTFEVIQCQ